MRLWISLTVLFAMSTSAAQFDLLLRRGTIYDGSGGAPFVGRHWSNGKGA